MFCTFLLTLKDTLYTAPNLECLNFETAYTYRLVVEELVFDDLDLAEDYEKEDNVLENDKLLDLVEMGFTDEEEFNQMMNLNNK